MIDDLDAWRPVLQALEIEQPTTYELALRGAIAVRIEPQLLRLLRIEVPPFLDVSAESDFWFSPLGRVRAATGLILHPGAQALLRDRLRDRPELLEAVWPVLKGIHAAGPPALFAEERLTWLALRGLDESSAREEARGLLQRLVGGLLSDRAEGLAHWGARALRYLPTELLEQFDEARMLAVGVASQIGDATLLRTAPGVGAEDYPWLTGELPRYRIWVRRVEGGLEFAPLQAINDSTSSLTHERSTAHYRPIEVQTLAPARLGILWRQPGWAADGPRDIRQLVEIGSETAFLPMPADQVEVGLRDGTWWQIRVPKIYIALVENDSDYAVLLGEQLMEHGHELWFPAFDGEESERNRLHQRYLSDCDAVVMCWANASEVWVRSRAAELKRETLQRQRPFLYAVVLGPPPQASKTRFLRDSAGSDIIVIDATEHSGLPPDLLVPLLERLPQQALIVRP